MAKASNMITILFYLLFFITPLIFFPKSSELFEFNKMVLTYLMTSLIVAFWIVKMILSRKIIFRRTILDIPLIIFLISQTLSAFVSIDSRTSLLGYYSRFHGGLASLLSYAILYWAYVSNMDRRHTRYALRILTGSAIIVSIWGILEHFGRSFSCLIIPPFRTFDVSCWVQDVQNRVFATLGQPNWLAAWIVALIPITWAFALNSKFKIKKSKLHIKYLKTLFWVGASTLLFATLLYTKSRSGLLGFVVADTLFWIASGVLIFRSHRDKILHYFKNFIIYHLSFIILALAIGTSWTPNFEQFINKNSAPITNNQPLPTISGPALEVGGTESGKIRQIVWKGAVDIWKNYPVLGSGVETFAFAYYKFRPVEHNLTSEWDYLYNKAHNEYLNYAATTGTIGLAAYLLFIVLAIFTIIKLQISKIEVQKNLSFSIYHLAFLSGFVSILVTNFFGFSVVPVTLLFFLYPAFAVSVGESRIKNQESRISKLSFIQMLSIVSVLLLNSYFLILISKYWYADYLYAKGKFEGDSGNTQLSREILGEAVKLSPSEAIFWNELSTTSANLALTLIENGEEELGEQLAASAIVESKRAVSLSPSNVNIKRDQSSIYIRLSSLDQTNLLSARDILEEATEQAPNDAKLHYNLSLSYLRTGDYQTAVSIMEKTVNLKPNYSDARFALALMYFDVGEKQKAKEELLYILQHINPNDPRAKRELEEIGP